MSHTANEKKKNGLIIFFELVYRKFPKLVLLNLVYFLCILPLLCGGFYLVLVLFRISPEIIDNTYAAEILLKLINLNWIPLIIKILLFSASALAFGPLTCGFTYVLRCHVTEQHAWFSDFFTRARDNWKQGIALGMIDLILCLSLLLYLSMDLSVIVSQTSYFYFMTVMKYLSVVIAVVYFVMRFYTYTIAVSVDLKLKDIFKNSLLFLVLGFFKNILALVLIAVVVFSFLSTSYIDIVLICTTIFSFGSFIPMYLTFPVVKKYMYPKELEEVPEITE